MSPNIYKKNKNKKYITQSTEVTPINPKSFWADLTVHIHIFIFNKAQFQNLTVNATLKEKRAEITLINRIKQS